MVPLQPHKFELGGVGALALLSQKILTQAFQYYASDSLKKSSPHSSDLGVCVYLTAFFPLFNTHCSVF